MEKKNSFRQLFSAAGKSDPEAKMADIGDFANLTEHNMKAALEFVVIRPEVIKDRLRLENRLTGMVLKLPVYMLNLILFLHAINLLSPAETEGRVSRHIIAHFGLDAESLSAIHSFDQIYGFMEDFEMNNEKMQATSAKWWCEQRYATHTWDDHYMIPVLSCPSPRMYALGHPGVAWPGAGGGSSTGSSAGASAGSSSGSSAGSAASSSAGSSSGASSGSSTAASSGSSAAASSGSSTAASSGSSAAAASGSSTAASSGSSAAAASGSSTAASSGSSAAAASGSSTAASSGSSAAAASGSSTAASSGSSSGSSHGRRLGGRRLSGGGGGGGGDSGIGPVSDVIPDCIDDDHELQLEEGNFDITCASEAAHICVIDLGVKLCAKTCGFCAPFNYTHLHKFDKPQVTLMPIVVHQTRFEKSDCHGFAHTYESQPYNPELVILPALDGERLGRVLTCIDRNKKSESEYAIEVSCPKGAPEFFCGDTANGTGMMYDTKKAEYHGETVYPKMLVEAHKDIGAMRNIGWLDIQTESVTVSTLVYTEGLEIFTSVSIVFDIDSAGNFEITRNIINWRDMIGWTRTEFMVSLSVCIFLAGFGTMQTGFGMWFSTGCNWGMEMCELLARASLFSYCVVLLLTWMPLPMMAEEFDHLLHSLLDSPLTTTADIEAAIQRYFTVKGTIYAETQWMARNRMGAYIVAYLMFLQLLLYLDTHPRMGILTATIANATSHLAHFFAIFGILFCYLAFMAHWMFGGSIHEFQTFAVAMDSQLKMLYGDLLIPDGAAQLDGLMGMMFYIYCLSFLIIVYFTLLNFFLAIIVDAFIDVKEEAELSVADHDFITDVIDVPKRLLHYSRRRWPRLGQMVKYINDHDTMNNPPGVSIDGLEDVEDETKNRLPKPKYGSWTPDEFMEAIGQTLPHEELDKFLSYYFCKCPLMLAVKDRSQIPQLQRGSSSGGANEPGIDESGAGNTVAPDSSMSPPALSPIVSPRASNAGQDEQPLGMNSENLPPHLAGNLWQWDEVLRSTEELCPHLRNIARGDPPPQDIDWDKEALELARRIAQAVKKKRQDENLYPGVQGSPGEVRQLDSPPNDASPMDTVMDAQGQPKLQAEAEHGRVPDFDALSFLDKLTLNRNGGTQALSSEGGHMDRFIQYKELLDLEASAKVLSKAISAHAGTNEMIDERLHNIEKLRLGSSNGGISKGASEVAQEMDAQLTGVNTEVPNEMNGDIDVAEKSEKNDARWNQLEQRINTLQMSCGDHKSDVTKDNQWLSKSAEPRLQKADQTISELQAQLGEGRGRGIILKAMRNGSVSPKRDPGPG